ncbi:MAG: hypothetical protein WCC17_07155 [Candidatus Nitrosopolaris sp.]
MGSCYQKQRRQSSCDIYKDIRCSLVHSYVINKSTKIKFRGGKCGVVFNQFTKEYTLYIERYYLDFKNHSPVDRYISELEKGSGLDKMERALKGKSILV